MFNDYYAHRITAEMDTRDREWLYSGTCEATRLAASWEVKIIERQYSAAYAEWQDAVSRVRAKDTRTKNSQRKHIKGTSEYNAPARRPSYFVHDDGVTPLEAKDIPWLRKTINALAGTGVPEIRNSGQWNGMEDVPHAGIHAIDRERDKPVEGVKINYGKGRKRTVRAAPMWSGRVQQR